MERKRGERERERERMGDEERQRHRVAEWGKKFRECVCMREREK